jgi:ubiquinone/menaquinone biosynthesis C-methylase UbiE
MILEKIYMTLTNTTTTQPGFASRFVNGVLSIKPLADFAKNRARNMMIERAEAIGVPWRDNVKHYAAKSWDKEFNQVKNQNLTYPDYYLTSFHAYEEGNLSWTAAWEVESAAYAVHAKIWPDAGNQGDTMLRSSYHQVLKEQLPIQPKNILDLGCSVGMSTFTLQELYPDAQLTGVDLSPYFLAIAQYRDQHNKVKWVNAAAEATGLADASFDLVSACLMFHELPQQASVAIFQEARRLLKPGGYFTIMDMNPKSEVFAKMPPYILTLLKSTEPYLDQYFSLDLAQVCQETGFATPQIIANSPRHRTMIAQVQSKN